MMRSVLNFVAVIMMVAFVVAGFWTGFLGSEGMKVFWTSMLCAATLALALRGSILSNPWAITLGLVVAGLLLGIPAKLIPADNTGFGHMAQTAGGLTLADAAKIQTFALYGTVLVFLAFGVLEVFKPKAKQTTSSEAPAADNS